MSTNSINNIGAAAASATQTQATATNASQTADKNMFMKLLVAQLKNQDPLAPQDGTQFVAQLAQFNSVEQLMDINRKIGELADAVAASKAQAERTSATS